MYVAVKFEIYSKNVKHDFVLLSNVLIPISMGIPFLRLREHTGYHSHAQLSSRPSSVQFSSVATWSLPADDNVKRR